MRAQLTYVIDIEDEAQLSSLQGSATRKLNETSFVIASSSALMDEQFSLTGSIRGKPDENWHAVIRAANLEEAKAKALEEDPDRTVNGAVRGAVKFEEEPTPVPAEELAVEGMR